MVSPDQTPRGDPAFADDDRLTHEPVVEEERGATVPGDDDPRRPFPWALAITALALSIAAIVVVALFAA